MLKRKMLSELEAWKESPNHQALVIKGIRQCGKTTIVRAFCQSHYANTVEINFKDEKWAKPIFDAGLSIDEILMMVSARKHIKFVPGKTALFFDEIQECGQARSYLKRIVMDGRYDVIASGSLLGLRDYNRKIRQDVPVGYENIKTMQGLDFEEFLWANGIGEDVISYLRESYRNRTPILGPIHEQMQLLYKEYIAVGGMPNIVNIFLEKKNMHDVYAAQSILLQEYQDDFGKHLDDNEQEETDRVLLARIQKIFRALPKELARENRKFQYSVVEKGAKAREFQPALSWLVEYGLALPVFNLRSPTLPLRGNVDDSAFKIYFTDTGFLLGSLDPGTSADLLEDRLGVYKGGIYENAVASELNRQGIPVYYFHKNGGPEIDFVIRYRGKPTLVEVKSGTGRTRSADFVLAHPERYHVDSCLKLGDYNIGGQEKKTTLPAYLSFLLNE